MNNRFKQLKKNADIIAFLKSGLIAVASGVFVFGALSLIFKLCAIEFPIIYLALIAGGAAVIGGAVSVLCFYKSNMRFAKMLDEDHGLSEKVQTMVAFEYDTGDMLDLQRESAEEALRYIRPKKSVIAQLALPLVSLILAGAILVPSLLVSSKEPDDDTDNVPIYEEPFKITAWEIGALRSLIEEVNAADVYENVKTSTVAELERLLTALGKADTKDAMTAEVVASIVTVDLIVESAHTYKTVSVALYASEDENVKAIARAVLNVNGIAFGEKMTDLRQSFKGDTEILPEDDGIGGGNAATASAKEDGEPIIITLEEKLSSLSLGISTTLAELEVTEGDELYTYLVAFAAAIEPIASEGNEATQQSLIDKAFSDVSTGVGTALSAQYRNKAMRDTVINRLISIFGIDKNDIPELLGDITPELADEEGGGSNDDKDNAASGGYGEGNELYGSNDLIYDPFNSKGAAYVLYGDAFDTYYKDIEALLNDANLSSEAKQMLKMYFSKLSDGRKK